MWNNRQSTPRGPSVTGRRWDEAQIRLVSVRATMTKWCQGWWRANFWRSYQGGDWQATCSQPTPKSQLACQAFCEIRGRGCSIRRDELHGRWLEARAHLDISRARSSRPAYKLWFWEQEVARHLWFCLFKSDIIRFDWLDGGLDDCPRRQPRHKYIARANLYTLGYLAPTASLPML